MGDNASSKEVYFLLGKARGIEPLVYEPLIGIKVGFFSWCIHAFI